MNKLVFIFFLLLISRSSICQTSADFTFQSGNGLFCNPTTIQFTQTCTGNPTAFIWDFGDSTYGFSATVSNTYTQPGSYTVKLTAIYDQSALEVSKTIVINPVNVPLIGLDKSYICKPGTINLNATSSGNIANYEWDFGDTTAKVNTAINTTSHSYVNYGTYNIILTATDNFGCAGSDTTSVMVKRLPITATASPARGCIPANPVFSANVSVPTNDAVSNYTWDFGDGSPQISTTSNNTSHLYNNVGTYSPTLTVTTNDGCTNNFNYPAIAYGTPPFNHIAYPKKTIVCGSETPEFVSKATNANSYVWNFGDGTTLTVVDTIAKHKYTTLGNKTVTVTPYFNGCAGNAIRFQISVVGIIARYSFANTCADKKTFSFNNLSQGNLSSTSWDFGDGSPVATTTNAMHTFPASGTYNTLLIVTDSITGCADTQLRIIYTADPVVDNSDSSICKNSSTTFSILNNYSNTTATYRWDVAGRQVNTATRPTVTVKALTLGIFNNYVIINNGSQYCPDTISLNHSILVKGPDLSFNAPTNICFNTPYSVINTSKPFIPADSVVLWYWNFGYFRANDTVYQPQPYNYPGTSLFYVKLWGVDINGCRDSLVKDVTVHPLPYLKVLPAIDTICAGRPDTLIAFHSDSVLWSPGNTLSCTTCDTVLANPSVNTTYYVTAKNEFNCSVSDSINTIVYSPFTANPAISNFYICANDQVVLDVDPKMKRVLWSPSGGLSNPNIYNPIASPKQGTSYIVTLTDSAGCFSSTANINVIVKTTPAVNAGPDKTYPYNTNFTITPLYSDNINLYEWTPAALLNCSNCANPRGAAVSLQTYTIKVTSDSGCVASDSVVIGIECKYANLQMPTAFSPNNDALNDFYFPLTRGIKTVTTFVIYNRLGQLVFEAKNFPPNTSSFGWNGKYRGVNQPAGAYTYILGAVCEGGQVISKSGSILLLR